MILESTIYDSEGYRFLSDIDFMINPKDKVKVMEILGNIGYTTGILNWRTNEIEKLPRAKQLMYKMTNDHVPEHLIAIDDPIVSYVSVGMAMTFSWSSSPYTVDLDKAFEKITYNKVSGYEDVFFPSFDSMYHFTFLVMHLFKHAWLHSLQEWRNDVNLIKFADIMRFWEKYEKEMLPELLDIITTFSIEEPMFWVARHTDDLFGTNITGALNLTNKINEDILNEAYDERGNKIRLYGSMKDRLDLKRREKNFDNKNI